ncbi:MAG: hypothetical protein ACI9M1_000630 [Porticoccaceae bacterium]|jgi:hypothetical protein
MQLHKKREGSTVFGLTEQVVNDNVFNLFDRTIDESKKKKY